jgi:hypothetical protein
MMITTEAGSQVASEVEPSGPAPIQRAYCRLHRVALPTRYPVQHRSDLAFHRPAIVATRPGEELLCNSEHDGPHLWPDGDEAEVGNRDSGFGGGEPVSEDLIPDRLGRS